MDTSWFRYFPGTGNANGSSSRGRQGEDRVALALVPYEDPAYPFRPSRPRSPSPPLSSPSRRRPRSPSPSPSPHDSDAAAPRNKRACIVPASSKAILELREVVVTVDTESSDDEDCAICLKPLSTDRPHPHDDDLQEDQGATDAETTTTTLRAMPCSHVFHQDCIFQWLHRNAVCPLCRHQLPTTDDDDDEYEDVDSEDDDDEDREEAWSRFLSLTRELEAEAARPLLELRALYIPAPESPDVSSC